MLRTALSTLPLALLLGLLACGDEAASPAEGEADAPAADATATEEAASPTDGSCRWVTNEAASMALGAAVTLTGAADTPGCDLHSAPETFTGTVLVMEGRTLADMGMVGTAGEPADGERVEGLGDGAMWTQIMGGELGAVSGRFDVIQGGRGITIMLNHLPATPELRSRAEALARAVVAAL